MTRWRLAVEELNKNKERCWRIPPVAGVYVVKTLSGKFYVGSSQSMGTLRFNKHQSWMRREGVAWCKYKEFDVRWGRWLSVEYQLILRLQRTQLMLNLKNCQVHEEKGKERSMSVCDYVPVKAIKLEKLADLGEELLRLLNEK